MATQTRPTETTPTHRSRSLASLDRRMLGVLLFVIAAGLSFLLSIGLWFSGSREEGLYVGIWVPSILSAGGFWIAALGART